AGLGAWMADIGAARQRQTEAGASIRQHGHELASLALHIEEQMREAEPLMEQLAESAGGLNQSLAWFRLDGVFENAPPRAQTGQGRPRLAPA
ncbi:hypothetical protein ABRV50_04990, partial [Chromobacterium phragmitis]